MKLVQGEIVGRWVAEKAETSWNENSNALGLEDENGNLVAGLLYTDYTGASIAMSSRVDNPKAITREFLFHIFNYPFNELKVKRVTGMTSTGNLRAISVNEKLGWRRETVLKDYFKDGDGIVYIMRKEDCRWLKYKFKDLKCDTQNSNSYPQELSKSEQGQNT